MVAHRFTVATADTERQRLYPKTHVNYWEARLEHRTYTHDGKTAKLRNGRSEFTSEASAKASTSTARIRKRQHPTKAPAGRNAFASGQVLLVGIDRCVNQLDPIRVVSSAALQPVVATNSSISNKLAHANNRMRNSKSSGSKWIGKMGVGTTIRGLSGAAQGAVDKAGGGKGSLQTTKAAAS